MIGRIAGTLIEKDPPYLLVNYHGVGYEIDVPMSMLCSLLVTGEKVALLAQQIVHEDVYLPYDFDIATERETFRQLVKVSGIGARIVLAVLSGMSAAELMQAATLQGVGQLTHIPDVGKKTVERLLLELKGKLGAGLGMVPGDPAASDDTVDVFNALLALEYSDKEVALAIKQVPVGTSMSEGIKLALKTLSKS